MDGEGRPGVAARSAQPPFGREQLGQRDALDARHLRGVDDADGSALPPVRHDGGDAVAGVRQPQGRQLPEHVDACDGEPGLLGGLAQRGGGGVRVAGVGAAAGERHLAGVLTQRPGAFGEQDLGSGRAVAQEHEDGGGRRGPREAAVLPPLQVGGRDVRQARGQRSQPRRQGALTRAPAA